MGKLIWSKWFEKWDMTSLKVNLKFLEMEWKPRDEDRTAAWEMYVEMLTRIATQRLQPEYGDEKTALESVFSLFPTTREILRRNGRHCIEFTKVAVIVLNQVVRPFTAKWHGLSLAGAFEKKAACREFRDELETLQRELANYTRALADMAGVEDLTDLEKTTS